MKRHGGPIRLTDRGVVVLSLLSAFAALVLGAKGIDWTPEW